MAEIQRLEAENQRLRTHIRRLEKYIRKLEEHIKKLERIIRRLQEALQRIWRYVIKVLNETRPILAKRGGVPRGNWAYLLGADEVAGKVKKLVQEAVNG